jgi:hypothetical protein
MNLDKIFYLLTSFLLTLGVTFAEQRPNVIFLMIDDLGWTDFGCYGSDYYETPNIDKLAKSGMQFTNGYAACFMHDKNRSMTNFQHRIQTIIISKECNDEQN